MSANPLETLAQYFTGPAVAVHSVGNGQRGANRVAAEAFFKARRAFGVNGYMSEAEALAAIGAKLRAALDEEFG